MTFDYKQKLNRLKLNKNHFIWVGAAIGILLILGWFLNNQVKALKNKNLKNAATLNQDFPGYTNQSLGQFKQETNNLKIKLAKLTGIFDPKEHWFKKDYDLTIQFVEELGKVNQVLQSKAKDKQINYPELGFKEKLPSESEAFYLLSQLYGLKEVVSLGMDYSINFKSITPQGIEEAKGLPGIKMAKSSMELVCPAQSLIEFIIQLNDIIPRPYIESILLKFQDYSFEINLSLSNIIVDTDWKDLQQYRPLDYKEALSETQQNAIRILRSNNPLLLPIAKEAAPGEQALPTTDKTKQVSRFLYRGKATLSSREVVAIEDALNKETVFLAQGERIDNFIIQEFSDNEAILKNMDDGKEMIIKREEK